jgi:tetratricopeptide (TPR) repeat protein
MPSIRTVNMAWERKVRGSYAVSRFALNDAGSVTLALPRPLETRTYDLTRLALDGAADVRATFSVETLLELEASSESDSVIGMTSDDLYLLHAGGKSRFLADRRIIFIDSALCMDGRTIAAAFSDVAGSSFALAVGDITGRVTWLREADAPLSAIAISSDGALICQAADTGSIRLLDASRRDRWLFEQEEPVRALACAPRGQFTAYGTAAGGVGLIDAEGSRKWDARLPGQVVSLALSADGGICAALIREAEDEAATRLCLLDSLGQGGWEYESETRLTGLALSPGGRYMAASGRDGTHTLYEVVFGAGDGGGLAAAAQSALRQADGSAAEQDAPTVVRGLRGALAARPAEVDACERLLAIEREQTEALLAQAREQRERGDFESAVATLDKLKVIAPDEPELYVLLRDVRAAWQAAEIGRADELLRAEDFDGAGTILRGILTFAPHSVEARRRIAALDARRAEQADAEAERLLAAAQTEAALAELERAQQIAASAGRAERIHRAQIDLEFANGMKAYDEKRYREAVFQFKKVLALDPDHGDARRHLNFAQRFEQDSNEALNDRFGRLE